MLDTKKYFRCLIILYKIDIVVNYTKIEFGLCYLFYDQKRE